MMALAELILLITCVYAACGLLVGLPFVLFGAERIDPAVHAAPRLFRFIILPGAAALWPVIVVKWLRARRKGTA